MCSFCFSIVRPSRSRLFSSAGNFNPMLDLVEQVATVRTTILSNFIANRAIWIQFLSLQMTVPRLSRERGKKSDGKRHRLFAIRVDSNYRVNRSCCRWSVIWLTRVLRYVTLPVVYSETQYSFQIDIGALLRDEVWILSPWHSDLLDDDREPWVHNK